MSRAVAVLERFPAAVYRAEDKRLLPGNKITCSCGTIGVIRLPTFKTKVDPAAEARLMVHKFEEIGWAVGSSPTYDLCPSCIRKTNAAMKTKEKPKFAVVEQATPGEPPITTIPVPVPGASETAPRVLSREDRRIIFERVKDVYVDERVGYSAAWSDQRVADDLGVPRAWVTEIRDAMFGPVGTNEHISAQMAEADTVIEAGRAVCDRLQNEARIVLGAIDRLDAVMRDIRQGLGV